jgi:two-component system response regulator FixJ
VPVDSPVIFIVDDDASVRKAIRRLLFSLRLPVRTFNSAEQFLSDTENGARGCLVLDMKLPGMTGLQLQKHLATKEWAMPIVVVTAHDDDSLKDASMRLGAIAYLPKPFDRKQFLLSVQAALAQNHL